MRYSVDIQGKMTIDPPLTYKQLRDLPLYIEYAKDNDLGPDVAFQITDTLVEDNEGDLVHRRRANAIVPAEGDTQGRSIVNDINLVIDSFPEHTLTGRFDLMGEDGQQWRVFIRDGRAVKVSPEITWPEDSE